MYQNLSEAGDSAHATFSQCAITYEILPDIVNLGRVASGVSRN